MPTLNLDKARRRARSDLAVSLAAPAALFPIIGLAVARATHVPGPGRTAVACGITALGGLLLMAIGTSVARTAAKRRDALDMPPRARIADAAPGALVTVAGVVVAREGERLRAPVTGRAAVYYKLLVRVGAQEIDVHREEESVAFLLDDGSGRRADLSPDSTEMDDAPAWKSEFVSVDEDLTSLARVFTSDSGVEDLPEQARSYLKKTRAAREAVEREGARHIRIVESAVGPGDTLTVEGQIQRGGSAYRGAGGAGVAIRPVVVARAASPEDLAALRDIHDRTVRLGWRLVAAGGAAAVLGAVAAVLAATLVTHAVLFGA